MKQKIVKFYYQLLKVSKFSFSLFAFRQNLPNFESLNHNSTTHIAILTADAINEQAMKEKKRKQQETIRKIMEYEPIQK